MLYLPHLLNLKIKQPIQRALANIYGILKIFGTTYLTYHISAEHTAKYIKSVIYDLQKETNYKNIIVLINDMDRVDLKDWVFGLNTVILCEDTDESLQKLKYLQLVDWIKIIHKLYGRNQVYISEYNFCDYTDKKNKYISVFNFIDTEKIYRILTFLENNVGKQIDIVCSNSITDLLQKQISTANYHSISINEFNEFIEKEIRIYD